MIPLGRQIRLRDWGEADVEAVRRWHQPDQAWQRFDAPYLPDLTAADVDEMVAKLAQGIAEGNWPTPRRRIAIADRVSDQLVGNVSWYWHSRETQWLNVGIVLYDPATWGQGRGTEALGLWCEYLFATMPQIVRLGLMTWSGNHGMIRLAAKLGFQEEARFRKARIVNGEYYDSLGYGILREEWTERFPRGFTERWSHTIL
jgi:putative hydrolase of HD superfamily